MKINPNNLQLTISAASAKQYPETDMPEIALAGPTLENRALSILY